MPEYFSRFYPISGLAFAQRLAMQRLYMEHYDATSPEMFQRDMDEKDAVQIVYHEDALVGFSTYLLYRFVWQKQPLRVVFSGDTIVSRRHWGQQALALDWLGRMGAYEREEPEVPLYWFLSAKGHRTYRYLSVFAREFYPHWEAFAPDLRDLAHALAAARFGADFRPESGVISFQEPHGRLAPEIAEASEAERAKEPVGFFLRANPGYRRGDELVCLCRLCADNLRPLARRAFVRKMPHV